MQGVEKLHGTQYEVLPDRIEGGTYLLAGAITCGRCASRTRVRIISMRSSRKLIVAGAKAGTGDNWIEVDMSGKRPKAVDVRTAPSSRVSD